LTKRIIHQPPSSPVALVDKVLLAPMAALEQLDVAAVDFNMEADSIEAPSPPILPAMLALATLPLCSPLSIHQVGMVSKTTTYDERPSNDAMEDQGERADAEGVLADGGGFGNQVDQLSSHPFLTWVIS